MRTEAARLSELERLARAKRWRLAMKKRGWSSLDVAEQARIDRQRCFSVLGGDITPRDDEVAKLDALLRTEAMAGGS